MISTMFQSATILLREGLEAMLVIAALAAYIQKAGMHHRLRELYVGSVVAVAASFLAAWLFEVFNNRVHNDVLEGVTILARSGADAVCQRLVAPAAGSAILAAISQGQGGRGAVPTNRSRRRESRFPCRFPRRCRNGPVHPCARSVFRRLECGTDHRLGCGGHHTYCAVLRHQRLDAALAIAAALYRDLGLSVLDGTQVHRGSIPGVSGAADRSVYRSARNQLAVQLWT